MVQSPRNWIRCLPLRCIFLTGLCAGVEVWEGESVVLPCDEMPSSSPVDVRWCKFSHTTCEGIILLKAGKTTVAPFWKSAGVKLVNYTSLKIPSVSYSRDSGLYRCLVVSAAERTNVTLSVLKPVKSVNLTGPGNPISENTLTSFICLANGGRPPPVFKWYIDDTPDPNLVVHSQDHNSSLVKLTAKRTLNSKTIKCEASVENKSAFEKTTINVAYRPDVTIADENTEHSEGDAFDLYCLVDANPPADVTWSFKTKIVNDNVYRITNFDQSQTGIYKCTAKNPEGTETESIVLTLKDSAELHKTLLFIGVGLGGLGVLGFVLTCIRLVYRNGTTSPHEQVENKSDELYDDAIELRVLSDLPPSEPGSDVNSLRPGSHEENAVRAVVDAYTSSESDHYQKVGQLDDESGTESENSPRSQTEGYLNPYSRRTVSFTREGGPYDIIGGWAGKRRTCSMTELGSQDEDEFPKDLSPRRRTNQTNCYRRRYVVGPQTG